MFVRARLQTSQPARVFVLQLGPPLHPPVLTDPQMKMSLRGTDDFATARANPFWLPVRMLAKKLRMPAWYCDSSADKQHAKVNGEERLRFDVPTLEHTFRAIVVYFSAVSSSYIWRPKDTDGKSMPARFWFGRQVGSACLGEGVGCWFFKEKLSVNPRMYHY